ncbi:MAG: hypothetical protein KF900_14585 [Bacteroidetes bacterium]|nr:hypothetical protein [Bacteroidota bacterium]
MYSFKYILTCFVCNISLMTYGQCEDLTGNPEEMKNWKSMYFEYFHLDSTSATIKADSVLIYYLSNSKNETNYGMPCCYFNAEKFANEELAERLKLLYSKLEKSDAENFKQSQSAWEKYYFLEWEFIRQAFVGYANVRKYGQGREIMIHNQARHYQMIKERIITINNYINIASTEE